MLKKTKKFFLLLLEKLKKLIPTHLYSEVASVCKVVLKSFIDKMKNLTYLPIEDVIWFLTSCMLCASTAFLLLFIVTLFFI